jgi:hypothetical protein
MSRLATVYRRMSTAESFTHQQAPAPAGAPDPPSERRAWLTAGAIALTGLAVLIAVLSGAVGRSETQPPPIVRAATPQASAPALGSSAARIVARPSAVQQSADSHRFREARSVHIARRWMEGFYPIYATAQRTFGVNWLLIASIHMQESAFSTAPGIYQGLNFAHCCGGPMQFNVTNGSGSGAGSTWDLVSNSFIYGARPAAYDHMTATHPSIYDDFDSIMAAAHLLSADGAGYALGVAAWNAAYDYYGHDATGVLYADQVLGRAISWSQGGFCINCAIKPGLVAAVDSAYGAPTRAALGEAPKAPGGQGPRKKASG